MSNTEDVKQALIAHDAERMECYDHDGLCCPTCPAHDFESSHGHQAEALYSAGLVRGDYDGDLLATPTMYLDLSPKLYALANSMIDAPATAAVIRGFAHEVSLHIDDRDLTNAVAAWPAIVQHHAERERRLRDLTDALEGTARADETSAYDADLLHVVVGRLRDALDPPPAEDES